MPVVKFNQANFDDKPVEFFSTALDDLADSPLIPSLRSRQSLFFNGVHWYDYVLRLFDELKAYKNSVTLLLNGFADRLMKGEDCKDDCYTAICEYLANVTLRDLAA